MGEFDQRTDEDLHKAQEFEQQRRRQLEDAVGFVQDRIARIQLELLKRQGHKGRAGT